MLYTKDNRNKFKVTNIDSFKTPDNHTVIRAKAGNQELESMIIPPEHKFIADDIKRTFITDLSGNNSSDASFWNEWDYFKKKYK